MRRFISALALLGLVAGSLVALSGPAAAAVEAPWAGTLVVENHGRPDDTVSVLESPGVSTITLTRHREWDYTMTWTPLPDAATSLDPYGTTMGALAVGSFRLVEWEDTQTVYDPAACAEQCIAHCRTTKTTTWDGAARYPDDGPTQGTQITVTGQQGSDGQFHTHVAATMSVGTGERTVTEITGTWFDGGPCGQNPDDSVGGLWQDQVEMTFTSPEPPVRLTGSSDVTAHAYISPDDSATATIDMVAFQGSSIGVGAATTSNPPPTTLPVFTYTGAINTTRVADGTAQVVGKTPGTYTVHQEPLAGWRVTGGGCTDPTSDSFIDVATATATYQVAAGEDVVCIFEVGPTNKGVLTGRYTVAQKGTPKVQTLGGTQRGHLDVPGGTQVSGITLTAGLQITLAKANVSTPFFFNGELLGGGNPANPGTTMPCYGGGSCAGQMEWTYVNNTLGGTATEPSVTYTFTGYYQCLGAVTDCLAQIKVQARVSLSGTITEMTLDPATATAVVRQIPRTVAINQPIIVSPSVTMKTGRLEFFL